VCICDTTSLPLHHIQNNAFWYLRCTCEFLFAFLFLLSQRQRLYFFAAFVLHQEATGRLLCVIFSFVHVPYICHEDQEASRPGYEFGCGMSIVMSFLFLSRFNDDRLETTSLTGFGVCCSSSGLSLKDSPSGTGYQTGNLLLIERVEGHVYVTGMLIIPFSFRQSWSTMLQIKQSMRTRPSHWPRQTRESSPVANNGPEGMKDIASSL